MNTPDDHLKIPYFTALSFNWTVKQVDDMFIFHFDAYPYKQIIIEMPIPQARLFVAHLQKKLDDYDLT